MKKILKPDENQFLVVNRLAPLQMVVDLLRETSEKLRYVVVETAAGDYAIFKPEEFIREWEEYQQPALLLPSALIKDVPLFTAPRVSRIEGCQPATHADAEMSGEKRFVVLIGGAVAGLMVQSRKGHSHWEMLSQPVMLEDLIEVDDYYKAGYGDLESGSTMYTRTEYWNALVRSSQREPRDVVIHTEGKTRVYRRLADDQVRKRLKAAPKDKLVTLLNRGRHAGAIDFFEGEGDLGLGLNIGHSTQLLNTTVDATCPDCGSVLMEHRGVKDKVLLISEHLAEPHEVSVAATGRPSGTIRREQHKDIPEVAPESTRRPLPEIAPESTGRPLPEVAPEISPEILPGIVPELAPEVRPEIRPEIRPEVAAEAISGGVPERKIPAEVRPETTPAETRWINVEIDGDGAARELLVGKVYTLSLDVDVTVRDTSVVKNVEFGYGYEEGETGVELEVHLSSYDFKIYDDRQKLYVPRTGKSENKARFDIKPLHGGPGTLKALILKDNNFIQELTLTIEVGRGQSGEVKVESKGRPPEAATIVKPRDVHLDINYDNGRFELKFISGFTAEAIIDLSPQAVEKFAQDVRDVWDRIIEKKSAKIPVYQVGVDIPQTTNKDSLQKLAEAGFSLYKNIFYENQDKQAHAMGDLLRKIARDESLQIQITSDKFFLPWGVLYMAPNLDQPDADMFLGLKHVVEHIPKQNDFSYFSLRIDGSPKFSVSLNLDEGIDEEAAAKGIKKKVVAEQVEFWDRLKAGGSVEPVVRGKSTDLIEVFRKHEMGERLIYFYCHASARMDKSKPSITLGDGKRLSIDDLSRAEGEIISLPSAPLVFVNACDSAELSPFFYDDFLNFFVSRGARGAIGTECKIPAVFASEWARRFFTRFLPGKSLGELFLDLRREFYYKHNNLLGLAYALYCDGDTQILPGLSVGEGGAQPAATGRDAAP